MNNLYATKILLCFHDFLKNATVAWENMFVKEWEN